MGVNSKQKGGNFERKIANLLSDRFKPVTGIESGFRRNPDSGSFFGGTNSKRTQTHDLDHANFGDLICPNNFKYSVECKHYKTGPTFTSLVKGEITQWDVWLEQASQDSKACNKSLMLIMKYNNVDEVVLLDKWIPTLKLIMPYNEYFLYRLSDFLTLNDNTFFNI